MLAGNFWAKVRNVPCFTSVGSNFGGILLLIYVLCTFRWLPMRLINWDFLRKEIRDATAHRDVWIKKERWRVATFDSCGADMTRSAWCGDSGAIRAMAEDFGVANYGRVYSNRVCIAIHTFLWLWKSIYYINSIFSNIFHLLTRQTK